MIKYISLIFCSSLVFVGCQQKPTTAIEESVDVFAPRSVLMDTRSALDYNSFHIQGSVHLLVDDFLVLKNPMAAKKNQKRYFDPNLNSIIERLAKRGIHPHKKIYLIGTEKESIDNRKWKWLLNNLDVKDVELISFETMKKMKNRRFAEPQAEDIWLYKLGPDLAQELVINKAKKCFVKKYSKNEKWDEQYCQ
jgi:Rhodanese-like domain